MKFSKTTCELLYLGQRKKERKKKNTIQATKSTHEKWEIAGWVSNSSTANWGYWLCPSQK